MGKVRIEDNQGGKELGIVRGIPVFRVLEDILDAIFPLLRFWGRRAFVKFVGHDGWLSGLLRLGQGHGGLDDRFASKKVEDNECFREIMWR